MALVIQKWYFLVKNNYFLAWRLLFFNLVDIQLQGCKSCRVHYLTLPSIFLLISIIRVVSCLSSAIMKCCTFIWQGDYLSVWLVRHPFILLLTGSALLTTQIALFRMLWIKWQIGLMLGTGNCWLKSMIILLK